jgi:hypothetical protein
LEVSLKIKQQELAAKRKSPFFSPPSDDFWTPQSIQQQEETVRAQQQAVISEAAKQIAAGSATRLTLSQEIEELSKTITETRKEWRKLAKAGQHLEAEAKTNEGKKRLALVKAAAADAHVRLEQQELARSQKKFDRAKVSRDMGVATRAQKRATAALDTFNDAPKEDSEEEELATDADDSADDSDDSTAPPPKQIPKPNAVTPAKLPPPTRQPKTKKK